MARELGDVLHYLVPESGPSPAREAPVRVQLTAVPIGPRDVVRAAFVFNLGVELARLGESVLLVVPREAAASLWPAAEIGPLGTELVVCDAADPAGFARGALELASGRARRRERGPAVFACAPTTWLEAAPALLERVLLFSTPEPRALHETGELAARLRRAAPTAQLGLTIHGVDAIEPARSAFLQVAHAVAGPVGPPLQSYGLLVDDLHVYRAIAELRPLGLVRPQSRAARALRDVARLLREDARAAADG